MQRKKEFNYITFVADKREDLEKFASAPSYGEKVVKAKVRIADLENHKTMKMFDLQPYVNLKKPQDYFLSTLELFGIVKKDLVAFKEEMKPFDYEYTFINTKRIKEIERKGDTLTLKFVSGKEFPLVFSEEDFARAKVDDKKVFYAKIDAKIFAMLKEKIENENYKNLYKNYILRSRV